jgi:hypothetical protein
VVGCGGACLSERVRCVGVAGRARGMGEGVFYMVSVFLNGPAGIYGLAGPISVRPVGLYRAVVPPVKKYSWGDF